ncbi:MAG: hypothetical protein LKI24_16060 [Acidipropionibacterium sp.]|nr:hypothetical protein [Acidipropionibacterium sp.]
MRRRLLAGDRHLDEQAEDHLSQHRSQRLGIDGATDLAALLPQPDQPHGGLLLLLHIAPHHDGEIVVARRLRPHIDRQQREGLGSPASTLRLLALHRPPRREHRHDAIDRPMRTGRILLRGHRLNGLDDRRHARPGHRVDDLHLAREVPVDRAR